ncbi:lipoprotein [Streptomyces filamentosus NRRL 11379]|uniref:Lipoprotein n=1 Tax=Streptomyces filamentosus NRRL 15998 TaxID=457431 RepID=D6ASK5_STRFL|nr:lipoprotein [Streptomyces filamentosus NRRL 15998]EWS91150.1 lipoprotein [Streptomyces filamentosus NRRL 11379]
MAGFLLLAGCSTEPADDNGGRERPTPKPTATGTLEQLARKAGCDPNVQTDAAELRQANCKTEEGRYVLTTFATDRGQREWINEAKDYGGSYLVGRQWVAVGDAEVVAALRGRLGGTVETASPHHSGDSGGGGSEDGHSGHHPG